MVAKCKIIFLKICRYFRFQGDFNGMCLADGLAVMSVDLGSQFMKIAIVKVNITKIFCKIRDCCFKHFHFQVSSELISQSEM